MPVHRPGTLRSRRLTLAALLLTALSLTLPFTLPASAADTPARGSAYMGMGVLGHDGRHGRPQTGLATVPYVDMATVPFADMATVPFVNMATAPFAALATAQTEGVDVSSHQGTVAWSSLWSSGVRWAYVKATEGTYYRNSYFTSQYTGAYNVGMIRGAYHFATPDTTTGATQADYFVDRGGAWTREGRTLPGVLDIEWNPYGAACYGKTQSAMVSWIRSFLTQYKARTGRDAVIYTATSWWTQCTGNYAGFASANPLWIARYAATPGTLPAGWSYYTMWQYTSSGPIVGDHDKFNGALDRVQALARG